jgi:hypothetical protein
MTALILDAHDGDGERVGAEGAIDEPPPRDEQHQADRARPPWKPRQQVQAHASAPAKAMSAAKLAMKPPSSRRSVSGCPSCTGTFGSLGHQLGLQREQAE